MSLPKVNELVNNVYPITLTPVMISTTHERTLASIGWSTNCTACASKMEVVRLDGSILPNEYSSEVKKLHGPPPPLYMPRPLFTSSPLPEKRDEACTEAVHNKLVPESSGSSKALGTSEDCPYSCQCGDTGRPHSARCASCSVPFVVASPWRLICSYFFTHLPVCSCNMSTIFFRPIMQCTRRKFSHSSSATFPHPYAPINLSSLNDQSREKLPQRAKGTYMQQSQACHLKVLVL